MKRTTILVVILILLLSSLSFNTMGKDNKSIITVDDDGGADYTSIQDAIDNATDGDTIFVFSGEYNEQITINKSVEIIGEEKNNTIINGWIDWSTLGNCITIDAPNVHISGFSIDGGFQYNILIKGTKYNVISDNIIRGNWSGIKIEEMSETMIRTFNIINRNDFFNSHDAIRISYCSDNIIENNSIGQEGYYYGGITCYNSNNNTIKNNSIIATGGTAIYVGGECKKNTIKNNYLRNNDIGIITFLDFSCGTISNNYISNNSEYGIWSSNCDNFIISNNRIENNDELGILLDDCTHGKINNNILVSNGITIRGDGLEYWNTHKIMNNTANGRSIKYYKNIKDEIIVPDDTVQVILANCSNIHIENLEISNVDDGIQIGFSNNNYIYDHNIIKNNNGCGIRLLNSDNNQIDNQNTIMLNRRCGIFLWNSDNNIYRGNNVIHNDIGIYSINSKNNIIEYNNFINNSLNAYFEQKTIIENGKIISNKWLGNYWNEPKYLPLIIWGKIGEFRWQKSWFNVDWNPASEPYDIPIGGNI